MPIAEKAMFAAIPGGALTIRIITRTGDDMTFTLTQAAMKGLQMTFPENSTNVEETTLFAEIGISRNELIKSLTKLSEEERSTLASLLRERLGD